MEEDQELQGVQDNCRCYYYACAQRRTLRIWEAKPGSLGEVMRERAKPRSAREGEMNSNQEEK